jgi:beta-xylosidase
MRRPLLFLLALLLIALAVPVGAANDVDQGWRDDFDSPSLDDRWYWVREDNTHWSLTEEPGFLRITTQQGGIFRTGNDGRNILLTPASQPVFQISTKVSISPVENFHAAGILVYQDDDNYVVLHRVVVNGDQRIRFFSEEDGDIDMPCRQEPGRCLGKTDSVGFGESATTLYCRITKRGNLYIGEYSLDGDNWTEMHRVHAYLEDPSVGLLARSGDSTLELPAGFDYFEMLELSSARTPRAIGG